ncbi:MAG: glutamate racemase [Calditrichaeota bacterium]|nr:glutamate racemase [Calditrichota bacterium]
MSDSRPIGIFDSGIGGLTVARAIRRKLPSEDLIYFGDTARLPYGTKSEQTVTRFAQQIVEFLLRRDMKALVVACNTVSAIALPHLTEELPISVIGVIEPGVVGALRETKKECVGVIGTLATIESNAYSRALHRHNAELDVISVACPLFVPLAEEGLLDGPIAEAVAHRYLDTFVSSGIDALILGCTHYPFLSPVIQKVVGGSVALIDSGVETAQMLAVLLKEKDLGGESAHQGRMTVLLTDLPRRFREIGARFLGEPLDDVGLVSLARE